MAAVSKVEVGSSLQLVVQFKSGDVAFADFSKAAAIESHPIFDSLSNINSSVFWVKLPANFTESFSIIPKAMVSSQDSCTTIFGLSNDKGLKLGLASLENLYASIHCRKLMRSKSCDGASLFEALVFNKDSVSLNKKIKLRIKISESWGTVKRAAVICLLASIAMLIVLSLVNLCFFVFCGAKQSKHYERSITLSVKRYGQQ